MREGVPTVAIVGGGFAGAMTAVHLLDPARPGGPLHVELVERQPPAGRGVAYGTPHPAHVLNVPAGNMSAFPDRPADFVRWLAAHGGPDDPRAFAARGRYGAYVAETLALAVEQAPPGRTFALAGEEAIGLLPEGDRYRLRLASGRIVEADRVVVAIGNLPPAPPARLMGALDRPWFVADPWDPAALAPVPAGAEVLLIGTGLTAVDLAMTLLDDAGAGRVHLVSRRAMLPMPWRFVEPYPAWLDPAEAPTRASELLRRYRAEARRAAAAGVDWRAVFDAQRPRTQALWRRMPLVERRRFLRHARPYWEAHRHRMPPVVAERVAALMAEGRMVVQAARVRAVADAPAGAIATLAHRDGRAGELPVARVVVCTGPEANYRVVRHTLVLDLLGTGLARPAPLYLGLDVDAEGRLLDEDGRPGHGLWAVGSLRKGALWESTAVPELRIQAADVAARVLASLA